MPRHRAVGSVWTARAVHAAWFMAVGLLPRRQARDVLSWKLEAASRPPILAQLSKTIRRAVG